MTGFFSNNRGLTLIEMMIAVLMTAIMAAGIGYLLKTVVPTQRAYHARQDDIDAMKLGMIITSNVEQAYQIISPAVPTGSTPQESLDLAMKTYSWDAANNISKKIYFLLRFSNNSQKKLTWCTTALITGNEICTPTESLLLDWDNGAIKAESGTRFLRGIDVDGDGKLSSTERQFIRAELVLGFYEGPKDSTGSRVLDHTRIYYVEKLANVNDARLP